MFAEEQWIRVQLGLYFGCTSLKQALVSLVQGKSGQLAICFSTGFGGVIFFTFHGERPPPSIFCAISQPTASRHNLHPQPPA